MTSLVYFVHFSFEERSYFKPCNYKIFLEIRRWRERHKLHGIDGVTSFRGWRTSTLHDTCSECVGVILEMYRPMSSQTPVLNGMVVWQMLELKSSLGLFIPSYFQPRLVWLRSKRCPCNCHSQYWNVFPDSSYCTLLDRFRNYLRLDM